MRKLIRGISVFGLLAAPMVNAQELEEIEVVPEAKTSSEGFGGVSGTPEEYLVKPGDTLWDLSSRFLNNPWYWPKLWSNNPQLDNPNWIRPGTRLRLYPGASTQLIVDNDPPQRDENFAMVGGFSGADAADRYRYVGSGGNNRRDLFLTDEQIESAGEVKNSPEEKELLSLYDDIYITETEARVGDVLQVYRVGDAIYHPVTGAYAGRKVRVMGLMSVKKVGDKTRVGTLIASWGAVLRGDKVGTILDTSLESIKPAVNESDVKGYLLASAYYPLANMGNQNVVLIDRGKRDGVKLGNSFVVVRAEDPYTGDARTLDSLDIAKIMVIEVREEASTGLVTKVTKEIVPGDRVEMRKP